MGLGGTLRRFAKTCVSIERRSGHYDRGIWIENATAETFEIKASVQPAPPDTIQRLPEGSRKDGAKVIFPGPGFPSLRTAAAGDDGQNADLATIDGQQYEIAMVEPWRQHTRYVATRFGQ